MKRTANSTKKKKEHRRCIKYRKEIQSKSKFYKDSTVKKQEQMQTRQFLETKRLSMNLFHEVKNFR